jgi:hypothetical protein
VDGTDRRGAKQKQPAETEVWKMLLLAALAGSVGSILSRAVRLGGRQAFSGLAESPENATPLGIRAQLAAWQLFIPQVVVGIAAGALLYIVLLSRLVTLANLEPANPLHVVVLALLAGFSERLFLGTLDDLVNRVGPARAPAPAGGSAPAASPPSGGNGE